MYGAVREQAALPRTIGFWGTALFPINGMIGAGIFALPAIMVAAVGDFAPWMMLVGGLLLLPLAFVFAQLASRFDHSGGVVLYADAAFGRFAGFHAGWMRYASAVSAVAANTHVAIAYLAALIPALDGPLWRMLSTVGFIAFVTAINLFGMRSSVRSLGVMTAIKLLPLAGLIIAGIFGGNAAVGFSLPEFSAFESVVLLIFYAYMSFENATYPAGEVRDPKRTIPFALLTTLAAVTLFYMLVIWAYLAIAPQMTGDESALAAAAGHVVGTLGSAVIVIAAAFSIAANTFAGGVVIPRMTFGMAERGALPQWFMHVSRRHQTPDHSILFYGGTAILFGLWGGFAALAVASTLARLVTYLLSAAALPVLNLREGADVPRWHWPIIGLAVVSTLWVASHASAESYQMLGVIFVMGTVLYFIASREA